MEIQYLEVYNKSFVLSQHFNIICH